MQVCDPEDPDRVLNSEQDSQGMDCTRFMSPIPAEKMVLV